MATLPDPALVLREAVKVAAVEVARCSLCIGICASTAQMPMPAAIRM
jgi:hypothetical protein